MGRNTFHFDWVTVILLTCLALFGLFLLLTVSQALFFQQLIYVLVGLALYVLFARLDGVLLWWVGPISYVVANIFLLLSYFGPTIRGATRWIFLGPVQLQPSELVKPLLLLAFARFMTTYPPRNIRNFPLLFGLFILPFLLVFRQPDLGSSLVYISFWLAMMVAGGLPIILLALVGLAMSFFSPVAWHVLAQYQKSRILTFLNPALDPQGAGYNAVQSMIAVGSGQFFGRGLGRGTQSHLQFLPEHHTDFIFATLVEELGFLGGFFLLLLYALLLWRILFPFLRGFTERTFSFIYAVGLFALLLSQVFINAGMNMGIIPITGITLPFVSYGGSSILSLAIAFGLFCAITRDSPQDNSHVANGG